MVCLIVGGGNLSFSVSLAKRMLEEGKEIDIWTSTYEDETTCITKYGNDTLSNILWLKENGINVFHSINATNIKSTLNIGDILFTKIIFNFPHTGRKAGIKQNRSLLKDFLASCKDVITKDGCVEITLCAGQGGTPSDTKHREPQNQWQIVEMAAFSGFILNDVFEFDYTLYPEYKCTGKRGAGREFNLNGAMTHRFVQTPTIIQLNNDWCVWPNEENNIKACSISRRILLAKNENQFLTQKFFVNMISTNFQSKLKTSTISSTVERSLLVNLEPCLSEIHHHQPQFSSLSGVVVSKCSSAEDVLCSQVHYEALLLQKGHMSVEDSSAKLCNSLCLEKYNGLTVGWVKLLNGTEIIDKTKNFDLVECFNKYDNATNIRDGVNIILTELNQITCSIENLNIITMQFNNHMESRVIGLSCLLNYKGSPFNFLLLDMDTISCILIPGLGDLDHQVLWSLNIETQKRLENACLLNHIYKPFSLFPTRYEFQVSLWLNDCEIDELETKETNTRLKYSPANFMQLLKNVLDDLIVGISLDDEYVKVVDDFKRVSHSYKIVLQSHDFVFSLNDGRRLERKLRLNLEKYLMVVVR